MIETEDGVGLLQLLNRLVVALEPSRPGDHLALARRGTAPERWEDKDYLYVEAHLTGEADSDIDICIHGGLAFIRIVRRIRPGERERVRQPPTAATGQAGAAGPHSR